jgi:hypothetical protein
MARVTYQLNDLGKIQGHLFKSKLQSFISNARKNQCDAQILFLLIQIVAEAISDLFVFRK